MKTWTEWTPEDVRSEFEAEQAERVLGLHAQGKLVLVYENHDLGHPECGHIIAITWYEDELPDISKSCPFELPNGMMAWRYYPKGVLRP